MATNKEESDREEAPSSAPLAEKLGLGADDPLGAGATRVIEGAEPHVKKILWLLGGLSAVLIIFFTWDHFAKNKAADATSLYQKAVEAMGAPVVAADSDEAADLQPDDVRYSTGEERAKAAIGWLDKLDAEYGGTDAAKSARLLRAAALYDLGQYDQVVATLDPFIGSNPGAQLGFQARELKAFALEAKALTSPDASAREAGLKAALAAYDQLQPDDKGPFRDRAQYHKARVLALQGQKAEATKIFREILEKQPATGLKPQIEARLAGLDQG